MSILSAAEQIHSYRKRGLHNEPDIAQLTGRLGLKIEYVPKLGPLRQSFLNETAPMAAAFDAGKTPTPDEQTRAIRAFLEWVEGSAAAVVKTQRAALTAVGTQAQTDKVMVITDIMLANGSLLELAVNVVDTARRDPAKDNNVESAVVSAQSLRALFDEEKSNLERLATALAAQGNTQAAANIQAAANQQTPPGSPSTGIGGKLLPVLAIAAVVGVVGYYLVRRARR